MSSLSDFKLTDADIAQKGVVAAPDKLTGTAAQNKAIFDRLIREVVKEKYNDMLTALEADISDYLGETEEARRAAEEQRQKNENGYTDGQEVFHNGRVQNETARQAAEAARNVWESYDAAKAYVPGNKVAYRGSSYVCLAACTGVAPTDTSHWLLIAQAGGVVSFNGRTGVVAPRNGDYRTPFRQITLVAANWSNNAQTVTVTGVSAMETDQLIQPVPASASRAEYESCQVKATAQAANSLTFACGAVPTNDLTVYVCLTELEAAT